MGAQGRRKAQAFTQPIPGDRGGGDDQGGAERGAMEYNGQRLQRLAQAHVIRETSSYAPLRLSGEPLEAV